MSPRKDTLVQEHTGNRILDLLPAKELSGLLASSHLVSLTQGQVVYTPGAAVPHVYFPTSCLLGVVLVVEEGKQVEGTTVGSEGMLGLPVLLGVDAHPFKVVVQISGEAWQIPAAAFLRAAKPQSASDRLMRRYALYRLRCAIQIGACNSLHPVEKRMCRWLLKALNGSGQSALHITHEFLAELLGVRRQTVSVIARKLQGEGFISYRRGILEVLDHRRLEKCGCQCYHVLKQVYEEIMLSQPAR